MRYVACIERSEGFSTYSHDIEECSLEELLKSIREYAAEASENDCLDILGSTTDNPGTWEAIEDCWETYVVPAIEKRELVKKIKLVEDSIAKEESWFLNLDNIKAQKQYYIEAQTAVLKSLKEQL